MTRATVTRPKRGPKSKVAPRQIRTFRSAVNYLDSLTNYERSTRAPYDSTNFGIARASRLLAALGNPQRAIKCVHIAGTKGKGSTATMLAEMLRACRMKVGLYTSPHILDIRERIVVNGQKISEPAFAKVIAAVANVTTKARVAHPTYFEVLTAGAFYHFANEKVDIAVIEVGLAGDQFELDVLPVLVGLVVSLGLIDELRGLVIVFIDEELVDRVPAGARDKVLQGKAAAGLERLELQGQDLFGQQVLQFLGVEDIGGDGQDHALDVGKAQDQFIVGGNGQ